MIDHPEQHTWASLANGLGIRPPMDQPDNRTGLTVKRGELWPAGDPAAWNPAHLAEYLAKLSQGGSENYYLTALACKILLGTPADKLSAIGEATRALTAQKTVRGWMGSEIGTRTYWKEHLISVLVFYRDGDAALKALAGEWLALFVAWLHYATSGGRTLWLGQRSCEPGREQRDLIDAVTAGSEFEEKWSVGGAMLEALAAELGDAEESYLKSALAKPDPVAFPTWKTAVPVHVYRSDTGEVAVIVERSVNNNTPAILGASTVGGTLQWAPRPPYQHIRQKVDTAIVAFPKTTIGGVEIGPSSVLYQGSSFGYPDVALPLPAKPRIHWIVGGEVVREEAEGTAPAAPTHPPVAPPSTPAKHSAGCALLLGILCGLSLWASIALALCL